MIHDAMEVCNKWNNKKYTEEEYGTLTEHFHNLIDKYFDYPFMSLLILWPLKSNKIPIRISFHH